MVDSWIVLAIVATKITFSLRATSARASPTAELRDPRIIGTPSLVISSLAAATAEAGFNFVSRASVSSRRPSTPPAALISSTAISWPASAGEPNTAALPEVG